MSRLKELLQEKKCQSGVEEIVRSFQKTSRVSGSMNGKFKACNEREQSIVIEFPVMEWQTNENHTMHAGLISTAFDEAMGAFAAYLADGKPSVSINISLNYIKPIPMNDAILITAKVTSLGRKFITLSGECHLKSNGLLTNTALATFAIVG